MSRLRIGLLVLCTVLLSLCACADPLLKAGDRVVIYGDSITEQRLYSRYLQQYIYCRYPDLNVTFVNAGWSGDTARGGLNRLTRDVLVLKPTVVTLFFGMNDGGYRPVDNNNVPGYRQATEGIIKALQEKGIRVVVYTPSCVDPDRRKSLLDANYNNTLETLGKNALELAKQYNCPSADVFHPMLAYQNARKTATAGFTMVPDGVHPDSGGHLVMTNTMLQALGAEAMPPLGTIDMATGKSDDLRVVSKDPGSITLETTSTARVPFWFDNGNMTAMQASGFMAMAGQKLTVRGLTEAAYNVMVDGTQIGKFAATDLAAGVTIPGNYSARGKALHDAIATKETLYYVGWRNLRLGFPASQTAQQMADSVMKVNDSFDQLLHELATAGGKTTINLIPVPEGTNVALNKKYECNDPNQHNWNSGLTDGSWEGNNVHCFASNDASTFPKFVTIDLEQATRVNWIVVGVPNFGSTKTIKVAVSTDGKNFTEVGSHQFSLRKEERFAYKVAGVEARYVRLTYPDHYDEAVGYTPTFSFTSEVEVYAAK